MFAHSSQSGIGGAGENAALRYLRKEGYRIHATNWCNPKGRRLGEIDIIAQNDQGVMIFVEVKTRQITRENVRNVVPEEQITKQKLLKLQRAAQCYIDEYALRDTDYRFDAISVLFVRGERIPHIRHLESIFL